MKKHWKLYLIGFLFALNLIVWIQVYKVTHRELMVAFLNIGQGDSIFIQTPNGNQMLIDGGPNSSVLRELGAVMPFYDHSINVVLATHPDADHVGGLTSVFERYDVDAFIDPGATSDTAVFKALKTAAANEGANYIVARIGQKINLDKDIYFEIFSPEEKMTHGDTNDASIVGRLVYKDFEVLLTGDAPAWVENKIVSEFGSKIQSDILKLSHHGSKNSSTELFLTTVHPKEAIISSGLNNRYGHPHQIVLDRLKKLEIPYKNTAYDGRIIIKSDGSDFKTTL